MAMLEIRNVQKTFRTYAKPGLFHRPGARKVTSELPVLRGVDLTVEKGDVVAILGPSGSGKTTLLRCLNFLETADAGQLVFDGEGFDLAHASRADIARLRKKTAFVFQNYNLFRNKTALQNVTEGLIVARKLPKEQADEIGMKMLAKVGLADRADYYPRQLSGGQQQRVAIARALAGGHSRDGLCPQRVLQDRVYGKRRGGGAGTLSAVLCIPQGGAHPGFPAQDRPYGIKPLLFLHFSRQKGIFTYETQNLYLSDGCYGRSRCAVHDRLLLQGHCRQYCQFRNAE